MNCITYQQTTINSPSADMQRNIDSISKQEIIRERVKTVALLTLGSIAAGAGVALTVSGVAPVGIPLIILAAAIFGYVYQNHRSSSQISNQLEQRNLSSAMSFSEITAKYGLKDTIKNNIQTVQELKVKFEAESSSCTYSEFRKKFPLKTLQELKDFKIISPSTFKSLKSLHQSYNLAYSLQYNEMLQTDARYPDRQQILIKKLEDKKEACSITNSNAIKEIDSEKENIIRKQIGLIEQEAYDRKTTKTKEEFQEHFQRFETKFKDIMTNKK